MSKMKAFIDSSTWIFAFEFKHSNSAKVLDLILQKKIEAIINDKVLEEVRLYFRSKKNRHFAFLVETIIRTHSMAIPSNHLEEEMRKWIGQIKEKDLEHLATVKHLQLTLLIATNRDFEKFLEYKTPKQFLQEYGIKTAETDY